MKKNKLALLNILFLSMLMLGACDLAVSVDQAQESYQQQQDYSSLEILHGQLQKGMARTEVEALLGAPGYSPTDGIYYYLSKQRSDSVGNPVMGVVVEYIDEQGHVTDTLHSFWLGEVGE